MLHRGRYDDLAVASQHARERVSDAVQLGAGQRVNAGAGNVDRGVVEREHRILAEADGVVRGAVGGDDGRVTGLEALGRQSVDQDASRGVRHHSPRALVAQVQEPVIAHGGRRGQRERATRARPQKQLGPVADTGGVVAVEVAHRDRLRQRSAHRHNTRAR